MIQSGNNLLLEGELCLVYNAYWRKWSRVLHLPKDHGWMVELNLTPIDPSKTDNWVAQVYPMMIRVHLTGLNFQAGDRVYRHIVKNKASVVYQEVRHALLRKVPIEIVHRLVNEDFISEIDWERYVTAQASPFYRGGGIPFAKCKKERV